MIIVDTSVVIDVFRQRNLSFVARFQAVDAAICGVVRAEVLHGARTQGEWDRYVSILDELPQILVAEEIWPVVGRTLRTMSRAGHPLGFADAIIASLGIYYGIPVSTNDSAMKRIASFIPEFTLAGDLPVN